MSEINSPSPALQPAPPVPEPTSADAEEQFESSHLLLQYVPSWLTSFILHVVLVILLAIVPILIPQRETVNLVAGDAAPVVEVPAAMNLEPLEFSDPLEVEQSVDVTEPTLEPIAEAPQITEMAETLSMSDILNVADVGLEMGGEMAGAALTGESDLSGRSSSNRGELLKKAGGNPASEAAVVLGLQWLAEHQLPDGSWNFNHQLGPGRRISPNPGQLQECTIAATSMCLLAFLGNGQTQLEGDYKEQVGKALAWLVEKQKRENDYAGSLLDPHYLGAMYAHGLATIALCEAFAMTHDTRLHDPAQAAINYIAMHQDPNGGGWRYQMRQPGDLSVSGWQLMALKSGLMGDLEIPKATTKKFERFLNNVGPFQSGARYSYQIGNDSPSPSMTSVGLLCRMYLGWKREHPALQRGVTYLSRVGPSLGDNPNLYYDYYATQLLRQYGGEMWDSWNKEMRDYLIRTQSTQGATRGSWIFNAGSDDGIRAGGRVYCTALSIMTLEVYYRFLPIYKTDIQDEEFPLD